jgi:hypothetical protein
VANTRVRHYADYERQVKMCSLCLVEKAFSEYYFVPSQNGRPSSACKDCLKHRGWERQNAVMKVNPERNRARQVRDRKDNPRRAKGYWLWTTYRVTLEWFDEQWSAQAGRCPICQTQFEQDPHSTHAPQVDHDHKCCAGARSCGSCVRGLICRRCNVGMATFGEDPLLLLKAAVYLEESR